MTDPLEACFACGARVAPVEGPTHPYLLSTPGCWAAYGQLLAREYEDPARMALHRLTVDAYALQHPGDGDRRSVRSNALHLASLCAVLERGVPPEQATRLLQELARRPEVPDLVPPAYPGARTLNHVLATKDAPAHLAAVRRWAEAVWHAWSGHHGLVRDWVDRG